MGPVSEGSDTARLHEIASQVGGLAETTTELGTTGAQLVTVLAEAWAGDDMEGFVHDWSGARHRLDAVAVMLHRLGAELTRQADEQSGASEGGSFPVSGGPTQPNPGGGPTQPNPDGPEEPGIRVPDIFPEGIDVGPVIAKVMAGEEQVTEVPEAERPTDPGVDGVRLPEGADPNEPVIKELMATARGRELLTTLADDGIVIEVDSSVESAVYKPDSNTIVISPFVKDPGVLIHEASHAQWDVEDRGGDASTQDRETFIATEIDNEVEASTEAVYFAKERRMDGVIVERGPMELAYDGAYAEVVAAGGSPEEADQAGRGAIEERFVPGEDGQVEVRPSGPATSTDPEVGTTYEDHYGENYDDEKSGD